MQEFRGPSNTLRSLKHEDAWPHSPQVTGSSLVERN